MGGGEARRARPPRRRAADAHQARQCAGGRCPSVRWYPAPVFSMDSEILRRRSRPSHRNSCAVGDRRAGGSRPPPHRRRHCGPHGGAHEWDLPRAPARGGLPTGADEAGTCAAYVRGARHRSHDTGHGHSDQAGVGLMARPPHWCVSGCSHHGRARSTGRCDLVCGHAFWGASKGSASRVVRGWWASGGRCARCRSGLGVSRCTPPLGESWSCDPVRGRGPQSARAGPPCGAVAAACAQ